MICINTDFSKDRPLLARIRQALDFIYSGKIDTLPVGHHDLIDDIYVNVMEYETKEPEGLLFEAHRKYIDIHYIISGEESIEIADVNSIAETKPYDDAADSVLGHASGYRVNLSEKSCCVLMPEEAHLPGLVFNEVAKVKKAVIKLLY